ncbi:hypothetical protein EsH8_I_001601 [Colletotrichum jinshuiense]
MQVEGPPLRGLPSSIPILRTTVCNYLEHRQRRQGQRTPWDRNPTHKRTRAERELSGISSGSHPIPKAKPRTRSAAEFTMRRRSRSRITGFAANQLFWGPITGNN